MYRAQDLAASQILETIFYFISISFWCLEIRIDMRRGMLCWRWWVTPERWGRGGGGGWLLITDIWNISTENKAGKVKTPALFYAFRYFSWGCCVVLRAGRVCHSMFSVWGPDISLVITSSSSGQRSLPPPLQDISQDTCDFIQVSNSQQSPSSAEKGISSQYWALKDLIHCYNRSETFSYFQNIILAISHSIISVQCNVWFSWLQFRLWIFSSLLSLNND